VLALIVLKHVFLLLTVTAVLAGAVGRSRALVVRECGRRVSGRNSPTTFPPI
jgi:hypothetical protein